MALTMTDKPAATDRTEWPAALQEEDPGRGPTRGGVR